MTWKFPLGNYHKIRRDYQQCWLKSWTCHTSHHKTESAWVQVIIETTCTLDQKYYLHKFIANCASTAMWKRKNVVNLSYQYRVKRKTEINIQLLYKLSMFTTDSADFFLSRNRLIWNYNVHNDRTSKELCNKGESRHTGSITVANI